MLVPVGPIRIILQIVKFKNQEPRNSINGKSHRTMQYFYIVGYVTNGDDLKLCRVSLNQHELMSWARREATKHDERTYELYKQPITRTGKVTFVKQIKPFKKPNSTPCYGTLFDWDDWDELEEQEEQRDLTLYKIYEQSGSHHNK